MKQKSSLNRFLIIKCFLGFILSLIAVTAMGQNPFDPLKVIQPSPTAASLGVYGNNPVNYYNGTVGVTIPLYEIKTQNNTLPIKLSYFSTGVRVADNAGWTGLGWSLSAGGVITKTVRGHDDLYGTASNAIGYYNADNIPSKFDVLGNDYNSLSSANQDYLYRFDQGWIDTDPDIFNYNFNNYSGKFMMGKLVNGSVIYFDEKNNLKLQYLQSTDNWVVTDPLGYKYYFNTKEKVSDYTGSSAIDQISDDSQYGVFDHATNNITSSWFLDSIVAPSGETISFTYQTFSQSQSLISRSEEEYDMLSISGSSANATPSFSAVYNRYTGSKQVSQDVYLKQITFPQGSIVFNTSDRDDMEYVGTVKPGKLSDITIRDINNNPLKKFNLYYSYFLSNYPNPGLTNDYTNRRRLKLDSLVESGSTGLKKPAYKFTYFTPDDLPYKYTKAIDHWGYYNGKTLNTTLLPSKTISSTGKYWLGADRSADQTDANLIKGILSSITYPTGGSTSFNYELNDYANLKGDDQYSLQPQSAIANTVVGTYSVNFDIAAIDTPLVTFKSIFKKSSGNDTYVGDYSHIYKDGQMIYQFSETSMQPSGQYSNPQTISFVLYPGHYTMDIRNISGLTTTTMSISANWNKRTLVPKKKGGGLRIASVTNYQNGSISSVKAIKYTNTDGTTTGRLISPLIYDFTLLADEYTTNSPDQALSGHFQYTYLDRMSNSIPSPGLPANAGTIGYTKVTELDGANGENGKTEYYYSNNEDVTPVNLPYLPSIHDPLNGKLSKVMVYDATGHLIKKTEYQYATKQTLQLTGLTKLAKLPADQLPPIVINPNYVKTDNLRYYNMPSRWIVNSLERETLYDKNQDSITATKNSYYNNFTHLNLTQSEVIQSNGSVVGSYFYYPQDYIAGTAFIDDMVNSYVISKPIETLKYKTAGGNTTITGGLLTTYKAGGKGLIDEIKTLDFIQPVSQSSFKFSNATSGSPSAFSPDSRYASRLTVYNYDSYSNLLEQSKTSGIRESYKWGYQNQFPITQVINAANNEFYYEGYEESTATGVTSGVAHTGNKYTTNAAVSWTKPNGRNYVISYWYLSGGLWKYSGEQAYSGPSFTMAGGAGYDDVRIYPSDAQMSTYTFTPLVGMTSSTDAKGGTTTYEYDNFQRLINVKNKDGNIVKHMDYHYQNQ